MERASQQLPGADFSTTTHDLLAADGAAVMLSEHSLLSAGMPCAFHISSSRQLQLPALMAAGAPSADMQQSSQQQPAAVTDDALQAEASLAHYAHH
jgi:hypothetical protein